MKKITKLLLCVIICACSRIDLIDNFETGLQTKAEFSNSSVVCDSSLFYYSSGEKIFLKEKKNQLIIGFVDAESRKQFIEEIHSLSDLKIWNDKKPNNYEEDNLNNLIIVESSSGTEITEEQKIMIKERQEVLYLSPIIESDYGTSLITDEFAVKLRNRSDYDKLKNLVENNGCKFVSYKYSPKDAYYIKCSKESKYSTIHMAAYFYETGLFEYSAPNFLHSRLASSADQYYSYQWGLENNGQSGSAYYDYDIDIENAWDDSEGNGVIVAIVDDGIDLSHPDLTSNLITGYDATTQTEGGSSFEFKEHGTPIAGIIGAVKDNGIGISGVAPQCKMMSINMVENINGAKYWNLFAASRGIIWAYEHGADVINCSWGGYLTNDNVIAAIQQATTEGREGLGCVIVCASGNNPSDNSPVNFPANLSSAIAVGAMSYDGTRVSPSSSGYTGWTSCYGTSLDVVAPGLQIYTTKQNGEYGNFEGTSAAAPFVSGVATLVISRFPNLPEDLVRKAIRNGAVSLPGYTSLSDEYYNNQIGCGLVNASFAISEASILYNQYVQDNSPGLDFTIINSSSYDLSDVIIDVYGTINGQTRSLISCDIIGGVASLERGGYPNYRGSLIEETPGTPITNILVDFTATCYDFDGDFEVGVAFDQEVPNTYQDFSFANGDTFSYYLPNITVPNNSRRMIYIRIFDKN